LSTPAAILKLTEGEMPPFDDHPETRLSDAER